MTQFQESILMITLIPNIQEINLSVLDVSKLLRRRGAWGFTLFLYMTLLSSPATNVHLRWRFKDIYKGIFCEYMKERDFNASFVITGLLRNQRWQRTLNWYMAWAINQILKSNISVCVFSVERPTLPKRDLINTWCFTQGKSVSVVNTVKRPLPRNLFFSSTSLLDYHIHFHFHCHCHCHCHWYSHCLFIDIAIAMAIAICIAIAIAFARQKPHFGTQV